MFPAKPKTASDVEIASSHQYINLLSDGKKKGGGICRT